MVPEGASKMGAFNPAQMLFEFGADLAPVQAAGDALKKLLEDLNSLSDRAESGAASATSKQQSLSEQMGAAAKQAVADALALIKAETGRSDALQKQVDTLKSQLTAQADLLKTSQDQRVAAEAHLDVLKKQTEEYDKHSEKKSGKEGGEGGLSQLGEMATKVTAGALGGSLGPLFEAVVGGNLFVKGLEQVGEALDHFIEKLKDAAIEGGKLVLLDDQFQRLARGAGVDATEMMKHLDDATEGLVSKFELLELATAALSSPLHLGADDVAKLTQAVVRIAEYSGGTASQAIGTLTRAIQTGNLRMLGSLPGMDRFSLMMTNISSTAQGVTRRLGEASHAMGEIIKRSDEIGETPKTLEQAAEMFAHKWNDIFSLFWQRFE